MKKRARRRCFAACFFILSAVRLDFTLSHRQVLRLDLVAQQAWDRNVAEAVLVIVEQAEVNATAAWRRSDVNVGR